MSLILRSTRVSGSRLSTGIPNNHVSNPRRAMHRARNLRPRPAKPSSTTTNFGCLPGSSHCQYSPSIARCSYCGYSNSTKKANFAAAGVSARRWLASSSRWKNGGVQRGRDAEKKWTTGSVDVPVGGNGTISLSISTLSNAEPRAREGELQQGDVAVYLPPGPLSEAVTGGKRSDNAEDERGDHSHLVRELSSTQGTGYQDQQSSISAVVTIHYRLASNAGPGSVDDDHRYPTPIHDVSIAFDWILEHIQDLQTGTITTNQTRSRNADLDNFMPRISIFGSHIGGSLALTLALTQPNDIYAVAVRNPITDWAGLDDLAAPTESTSSLSSRRRSGLDSEESRLNIAAAATSLVGLRTRLFRNPSGFFDAFASPLMFLRAPGRDTPLWRTARPEAEEAVEDEISEAMKKEGGIEVSKAQTQGLTREQGYGPYDDDWHTAPGHDTDVSYPKIPTSVDLEQAVTDLSNLSLNDRGREHGLRSVSLQQPKTDLSQPQLPQSSPSMRNPYQTRQATKQSESPTTLLSALRSPSSTRRRKVIRRWPPNGPPDSVELPYVKIFSTLPGSSVPSASSAISSATAEFTSTVVVPHSDQALNITPKVDLAYVLHPQAKEMVDVMRRACFWGRETAHAEAKVQLEVIDATADEDRGEDVDKNINEATLGKMVQWVRGIDAEIEHEGRR